MNTAEIKNHLHELIVETNDIDILTKIQTFINQLRGEQNVDWWDELSEENKESIERGLNDIESGRTHTDEVVRESVRQRILKAK